MIHSLGQSGSIPLNENSIQFIDPQMRCRMVFPSLINYHSPIIFPCLLSPSPITLEQRLISHVQLPAYNNRLFRPANNRHPVKQTRRSHHDSILYPSISIWAIICSPPPLALLPLPTAAIAASPHAKKWPLLHLPPTQIDIITTPRRITNAGRALLLIYVVPS